ncbi:hypothetical protein CANCADRAFT_3156 [Tortispora caseinolytica NRRL Y-17796]|uniref:CBS domain-containing protein n=1 Tax=Tortispora caseinolytica NRRL Y-17796 TaxID=767744 RepID=A0A1E4T9T1_9ASCO|nr:hypothetical protein CANCADRAFT_3156 [Tortispora caseinolytica NRRL Y-17796]
MVDYRGATVEDLQLGPAFTVQKDTPLGVALELSYEREYSYVPVVDGRKLLGFLTADYLRESSDPTMPAKDAMTKFSRSRPFRTITPDSPLEDLDKFFESNELAIITDADRKFVLGVAVKEDLDTFAKRRGL